MESILAFFHKIFGFFGMLLSAEALQGMLQEWGWLAYPILFIIVFAETGLLVGFFLPGDSLLFISGFLCSVASGGSLNFWILCPLLMIAAISGDTVGYWLGRKTGPVIFCREDSFWFHKKHLIRTQKFYEKYGGRTIIYARFVPIVRTFAPFVAGVGKMDYKRFLSFNIWGGIGWIASMMLAGYFLGQIEIVKKNLEKAVILVIFISILPIIFEYIRSKMHPEENEAPVDPTKIHVDEPVAETRE